MRTSESARAVSAALSSASSLDLAVDRAVVLRDSNRLTLRLLPCDVVARVAALEHDAAQREVDVALRLSGADCAVAALDPRVDPRVHERDGFAVTFWTYYRPVAAEIAPAPYADALVRLHAGLRGLDVPTPHVTDRVEQARLLVAAPNRTPALADADRGVLADTLTRLGRALGERGGVDQVVHGEPHPGNVLATADGPVFIDVETCCRGPVEFDLAHAPVEVARLYPGVDHDLLRDCRILVLAMITTWRWERDDQLPGGRRLATEWLARLRAALG